VDKRVGRHANRTPRVSVVIPAHNVAAFISETLESVLAQTFTDYEIVVVNDGSTDTTELETQLTKFWDVIVYLKQPNGGTARARNTGIEHSRGELIAFLDADDIWLPEYLREQIAYLDAGRLDMAYANASLFGAVYSPQETYMDRAPSNGPADFEAILSGRCNVITSGTVVVKRRIVELGMFDASLPGIGIEDFDLWLRMAKSGARIGYQRQVLLHYRVRLSGLSGNIIQQSERTVVALKCIKAKTELTAREEHVWRHTLNEAEAQLLLETGKAHLLRGEFREARLQFRAANGYYNKPKLRLVDWALSVAPITVAWAFKTWRAPELQFIPVAIDAPRIGNGSGAPVDRPWKSAPAARR